MIVLSPQKPLGQGSHRAVYRHPDKPDRCLKIMTEDWRVCLRRQRAGWLARTFRPKRYFHENLTEHHFSNQLRRKVGDQAWDFVAQSYGFVETDQGEALEVELIQHADGSPASTLEDHLLETGMSEECQKAIEKFWEGIITHGIFVQGRPDNVAIRRMSAGSYEIVAIDGFGLPQLIPLARWFRFARQRFLRKRRVKQKRAIDKILKKRSIPYSDDG